MKIAAEAAKRRRHGLQAYDYACEHNYRHYGHEKEDSFALLRTINVQHPQIVRFAKYIHVEHLFWARFQKKLIPSSPEQRTVTDLDDRIEGMYWFAIEGGDDEMSENEADIYQESLTYWHISTFACATWDLAFSILSTDHPSLLEAPGRLMDVMTRGRRLATVNWEACAELCGKYEFMKDPESGKDVPAWEYWMAQFGKALKNDELASPGIERLYWYEVAMDHTEWRKVVGTKWLKLWVEKYRLSGFRGPAAVPETAVNEDALPPSRRR